MTCKCCYCGEDVVKTAGHYNRAKKLGAKLFCGKKCFFLSRRLNESDEEKRSIKYFYDRLLQLSDDGTKKKQRQEYFKKDYATNPEKYRAERRRRQQQHNEYCRQPKYKQYKKGYDQQYRAKKNYGEFWEAAITLHQLRGIVDNRRAKAEQKVINKSQNRKRHAKRAKCEKLERCTMGLHQPS